MTNQPPPLDAERVSDERLANMLAHHEKLQRERIPDIDAELGRLEYLYFADHIAALRELQRLRATQRESGGEWIDAETRRPEPEVLVLCWDGRRTFVDWFGSKHPREFGVTHWMPYRLPPGCTSDMHDGRRALSASQRKECGE